MTFPSARRPELIEIPSLARSPCAAVRLRRSEPARSTKWNLETIVVHSPGPSSSSPPVRCPSAEEGRRPLFIAVAKEGVGGRPNGGEPTRLAPGEVEYIDPGRARREGERLPAGGRGEFERGGAPLPLNFF